MKVLIFISLAAAVAAVPQLSFKCSTAMLCVDRTLCDKFAVIAKTPVTLTEQEEIYRHPLVTCVKEDGGAGVCCRDPDYKDDWPADWVDPGRMSFEEYMALRIKKMVYTSTSPKPVPVEGKPVTTEPKPLKPENNVKSDDASRRIDIKKPVLPSTTQYPIIDPEPEKPQPRAPSSLDDSAVVKTPETRVIGHGRVENFATPKPVPTTNVPKGSTAKVFLDLDTTKVDRTYAGPPSPVKVIQSKPYVFHNVEEQKTINERTQKIKKVWPEKPIIVVSDDSIEVHANPKRFDITSIEQSKPSKIKKVVFTKELTPKKREKVTTEIPLTTPVPPQTGLHPLLMTGCPRRNRVSQYYRPYFEKILSFHLLLDRDARFEYPI